MGDLEAAAGGTSVVPGRGEGKDEQGEEVAERGVPGPECAASRGAPAVAERFMLPAVFLGCNT